MEKMKRCPSCGRKPRIVGRKPDGEEALFRVECPGCGFRTGERITAELAATSWNKRYASKFALPVGGDGREIDLGGIVTDACTGAVGQVASITFSMSGDISVLACTMDSTFEAAPARLMSGARKAGDMVSLEDDMQLSAAAYCAEILDCEEAADMMPLAAVEMKLRDVKKRLEEIGGL